MKTKQYLCYSLLAGLLSCSRLVDPNEINADDALLTLAKNGKTQLRADGKDQAVILARLPEKTGIVDVSFSTTAGTFIYSNSKEVKELADSVSGNYRYARTVLQTDSLKASEISKQVFVTVEVSGTRSRLSLTFVK